MAEVRFVTGWRRFFPMVGYHHVLMILIAIAIVLLGMYCKLLYASSIFQY